jgi:starvation-inducible DNA-binding protein
LPVSIAAIDSNDWEPGAQPWKMTVEHEESEMHKTRIDLSEKTRRRVADLLNARLADAIDLQTQAKQAHWNVKGPNFIALHKLFDEVAENIEEHVDTIAERITALGGTAEGALATVAKRTSLDPYPTDIVDGSSHVDALATALAQFGRKARKAIGESGKLGDDDTADLFTGVSRDVDKYLWFVEAHLQAST